MNQTSTSSDPQAQFKEEAAKRAVQFVQSGMKVGLGTGSTAIFATRRIAELLKTRELSDIVAFATSKATAEEAVRLGIPLLPDDLPEDLFDRSAPLPTGGYLEQADGTAWMALFCQNMVEIGAELAMANPAYISLTMKFVEHFLMIASGMIRPGEEFGMWDEQDGFFYDVLRLPDGRAGRAKKNWRAGLLNR